MLRMNFRAGFAALAILPLLSPGLVSPAFAQDGAFFDTSKVGPFVSLGNGTKVVNSNIDNSLIQEKCIIDHGNLTGSMIGNHAQYFGVSRNISLGDYSVLDFKNKN